MTPPLVCPRPVPEPLDCPLYEQRVTRDSPAETLRRAILIERRRTPDLADLIREEARASDPQPALPPGATPGTPSILDQLKETDHAESARPTDG
jgi:hypothetical protein